MQAVPKNQRICSQLLSIAVCPSRVFHILEKKLPAREADDIFCLLMLSCRYNSKTNGHVFAPKKACMNIKIPIDVCQGIHYQKILDFRMDDFDQTLLSSL